MKYEKFEKVLGFEKREVEKLEESWIKMEPNQMATMREKEKEAIWWFIDATLWNL